MNTERYAELRTRLSELQSAFSGTPEDAAAIAIGIYRDAAAEIKLETGSWQTLQTDAKKIVGEILTELDLKAIKTPAGQAFWTEPRTDYDTKALDALCKSNDDYRRILEPHRIVKDKGALTIRA